MLPCLTTPRVSVNIVNSFSTVREFILLTLSCPRGIWPMTGEANSNEGALDEVQRNTSEVRVLGRVGLEVGGAKR